MCDRLVNLRAAMQRFVGTLEPAALSPALAGQALGDVTAIEHMAATAKALLAARVAEGDTWRREGARTPAEHIANKTGTSVGAALDGLKLAERLAELPAVDDAARKGELSPQQAAAVASAAAVAPDEAARLVGDAKRLPLRELQAECGRTRAAHTDREALRRKQHAQRCVRSWNDAEGAGHIHATGPADAVARIMARVNSERDAIFRRAHREGREEPAEAYAFDALGAICCGEGTASAGSVASKVIVRVDLDTLLRGQPSDGETCEVAGVPVAVSAVEDILASGSAFLACVLTKAERLVGFVHLGRRPTAGQQTGLEWIYPTCAVEGCGQSARLERDHRVDWATSKITTFELLDLLCRFHHRLKTTDGWGLVDGRGKRPFVPPDDPRHPQHAPPKAA
jgi:hypothetical protein